MPIIEIIYWGIMQTGYLLGDINAARILIILRIIIVSINRNILKYSYVSLDVL